MIWTTLVVGKAGRRLADKCIPIPNNRLALDGPPPAVFTENPIRVYRMMESARLAQWFRRMSIENPLWGAARIHGELLKLGFAVAQSSVAKYMVKRRGPPSQGWCTFLHNHAPDIRAFTEPKIVDGPNDSITV
jgi:hypothetical protein